MSDHRFSDSDSTTDSEIIPEVKIGENQAVAGKVYHWGKLLTTPIGNRTIFKDVSQIIVKRNCHLTVIMRHDEEMMHPSLPAEWKVQRILLKKFGLKPDFINSWTMKEVFTDEFVIAIEKLPCIFTPDNLNEFEVFFQKYGHGFVKNAYVGGEVYLKISDKDNFDNIDYDSKEDPLLQMKVDQFVFRGGNPIYHKKAHLQQWRESLYSNSVELILDQDTDVVFYHDFVPKLTWLRNHVKRARGEALEEALAALAMKDKYLTHSKTIGKAFCPLKEYGFMEQSPVLRSTHMKDSFNIMKHTEHQVKKLELCKKVRKTSENTSDDEHNVILGQSSFVLKSFTSKCILSPEYWDKVHSKEDMFFSMYAKMVKALPENFNSEDLESKKKFTELFEQFGQGIIVSTYSGGEVELKYYKADQSRVSKNDHIVTIEQAKIMADKFGGADLNILQTNVQMNEHPQYVATFKGGNDQLKHPNSFCQWKKSLEDKSMLMDDQKDVLLHSNLIRQLSWIDNAEAKAAALEAAFLHLYCQECPSGQGGQGDGAKGVSWSSLRAMQIRDEEGALKEAFEALNLHGNVNLEDDRMSPGFPSPETSSVKRHNFTDSAYLSHGCISCEECGYLPGKGLDIFRTKRAHDIFRRDKIKVADFISDGEIKEARNCKIEKFYGHIEDSKKDDGIVIVGVESFVLKVPLVKRTLQQLQDHIAEGAAVHNKLFIAMLKSLPQRYSSRNQDKFRAFFQMFGQALLRNTYDGGAVRFILTSDGEGLSAQEVFAALSKVNCGDVRLSCEGDGKYLANFDGGLDGLKQLDKLPEWITSLQTYPCQIVLDWESDMMFYHDFIQRLGWLKDAEKKARALEDAFVQLYP